MLRTIFITLLFFNFLSLSAQEGEGSGVSDTIEYIKDSDTIREIIIEEVTISDENTIKLTKAEREQIKLLEFRVRVVYPYAKLTAEKLTQINATMAKLKSQKEKRKYFKLVEKYLNEEFEPKLKKLSRKQGQILVKLINRQTGQTTFDLIKDYKSGWKAFWSNNTAKLFNIDLKKSYDPMEVPEDFYIESYLQRAFDEGRLVKQEAKKPISSTKIDLTPEAKIVADNFRANKGRLPYPVERGKITLGFGYQPHPVYKSLMVHNSGVEITTDQGATARAVFDGVVTSVFDLTKVTKAVMIQHGDYFTVYQNLSSVNVSMGDKVSRKQALGRIRSNGETGKTVLKFLIYQNTSYINPAGWLSN